MSDHPSLESIEAGEEFNLESARAVVNGIAKDGDDLLAVYAVEVIKKHLKSKVELDLLLEAGLTDAMNKVLDAGHEGDVMTSRVPSMLELAAHALKFEGAFEKLDAECNVMKHLAQYTASANQPVKASAFSATADLALCTANEGTILANAHYGTALENMTRAASLGGQSEVQVHALHCLAATFTRLSEAGSERAFQIVNEHVFNGERLLSRLVHLMKAAFEDVNTAAHAVLAGICHHAWGRKMLDSQPAFYEQATDRNSVRSYEVTKLRHKIASLYAANKDEGVDPVHRARYAVMVEEGAFAKDVVPRVEVATES
ncbi:hypothetical protein PTSG_02047 [Salpingoeca rosetta]|uniref:Uncharacterized protein n=1 Tax=Salpingoeca rosetta (strain ATCC 50818 / BSB-021) TaxID=946362 RepID=F2TZQ5_SALR5|nr:uncharacterized protein PTSG_02047 [Salpingoeca rosetta]EGD79079.1 hypothetical protein PTSG_02047 [Salpingoeca rosetta]|eukprot:XP_004998035.1 hypothetical protein PTSG_02047 [Salpingoeca rosetta]